MAPLFAFQFDMDQSAGRQMGRMHRVSTDAAKLAMTVECRAGQRPDGNGYDTEQFSKSQSREFRALYGLRAAVPGASAALDDADISEFERMARHVHLAPNEALFTAGEVAGAVHSMMSGVVRLYKLMPDGRRQVLGFALPGDFLGIAPSGSLRFFSGRGRYRLGVPLSSRGIHAFH